MTTIKGKGVLAVVLAAALAGGTGLVYTAAAQPPGDPGPRGERAKGDVPAPPKTAEAGLPPLTLAVGKRYQLYLPNGKAWPSEQSPVHVEKVFAGGWVEVTTKEKQAAFINLNHVLQVYPLGE